MNIRNNIIGIGIVIILTIAVITFINYKENTFTCTRGNNDVLTFKLSVKTGERPITLVTENGKKVSKEDGEFYFTYLVMQNNELGQQVIDAKLAGEISGLKKVVAIYEKRYDSICK